MRTATPEDRAGIRVDQDPCDRIVFASRDVVLGEFRCPVAYQDFRSAGRIHHHVVAFPRTWVWIEREDARRFVADPGLATIYNPATPYVREPLSPDGDLSDWLGISDQLAREAVARFCPADADHPEPFRHAAAPVSGPVYVTQRGLFRSLRDADIDPLRVEEQVFAIVLAVLASAYGRPGPDLDSARRTGTGRGLVEKAKATILSTLFENLSVCDIASSIEVSPFHLCRTFRRHTGMTLHEYRREMRLRSALGLAVGYRGRLSELALRAGFSSHSHFTTAYRRAFGISPSASLT